MAATWGGVNIAIKGGTTQPTNPKENTIWVNTSTAIKKTVFSASAPSSPTVGTVWFVLDSIYLVTNCKIYGTDWEQVESYLYSNGTWVKLTSALEALYIIQDGTEMQTLNGYASANSATKTQGDGYITLAGSSNGYFSWTTAAIDISDYSTLKIQGTFNTVDSCVMGVWASTTGAPLSGNVVASVGLSSDAALDISSLTGNYKLGLTSEYTRQQKVTNFFVE